MTFTVCSWNIYVYGKRNYRGIADVIRKNSIDIIGIQEGAIYYDTHKPLNMIKKIASELNYNFAYFTACDKRPEKPLELGNAVISRFPIIRSQVVPINYPTWPSKGYSDTEPRNLIVSKIRVSNDKMINFLTTHLQFSVKFITTDVRLWQVKKLLRTIKDLRGVYRLNRRF